MRNETDATLLDLLDKLLETGAAVKGDVMIRLADVDLMYLGINVVVSSISKMMQLQGFEPPEGVELSEQDKVYLDKLEEKINQTQEVLSNIDIGDSREEVEKGMASLVLTLVELIRRLMERESLRQMNCGYLTDPQAQKLGMSLKALSLTMDKLKKSFDLKDEDLGLDLGPLGELFH